VTGSVAPHGREAAASKREAAATFCQSEEETAQSAWKRVGQEAMTQKEPTG
jgi:hypothetical protein